MPPVVLPSAAFSWVRLACRLQRYGLLTGRCYLTERFEIPPGGLGKNMLKEVMLGSGGIMLAAAIFASSVAPSVNPAPTAPEVAPPVVTAPVVAPPQPVAAPQRAQIFPEETGDVQFGAPMIQTAPVESGQGDTAALSAAPDTADAAGGRQFNSKPGRAYPIPK